MPRRRRRWLLLVLAVALLGSCTAVGLSVAGGRGGTGSGTVTATADVDGTPDRGRPSSRRPAVTATPPSEPLGTGAGTVSTAPSSSSPAVPSRPAAIPARAAAPARPAADELQPLTLTLAGSTAGLVPGRPSVLPVRVTHDNDDDVVLTLRSVDAVVRGSAGSCGPSDLTVTAYDADAPGATVHALRPGESVVVELPVVLLDDPARDQSDCAGATFPLTLSATAGVTA